MIDLHNYRGEKMLKTLMILVTFISLSAFADDHGKMNDADKKAKILGNIDSRIASLNTMKSCVEAASDRKAIKECRKSNKDRMKSMKKKK